MKNPRYAVLWYLPMFIGGSCQLSAAARTKEDFFLAVLMAATAGGMFFVGTLLLMREHDNIKRIEAEREKK